MTRHLAASAALAINAEAGSAPDWVQLLPSGPMIAGRDGRAWVMDDPAAIVAAFEARGHDLPVDFEHATEIKAPNGDAAPAVGWIREMQARDGAIWGRVDWLPAGRAAVSERAYRYLSPVFLFDEARLAIRELLSAGLTNQPNLHMAALNRAATHPETAPKETEMDKALLEALGLAEGASLDDVLTAINALKADEATARNRAETPDLSSFVPRADYDTAMNRVRALEAAEQARADAAIEAEVDAAVESGKVAPASRDFYLAACRAEGGLDRFRDFLKAAPVIADKALNRGQPDIKGGGAQLHPDELVVCRQLGLDPKAFAEAKAKEEQ